MVSEASGGEPATGLEDGDRERLTQILKNNQRRGGHPDDPGRRGAVTVEECRQFEDLDDNDDVTVADISRKFDYAKKTVSFHINRHCQHRDGDGDE